MDLAQFEAHNEKVQTINKQLETIIANQAEGAYIRARAKFKIDGESLIMSTAT